MARVHQYNYMGSHLCIKQTNQYLVCVCRDTGNTRDRKIKAVLHRVSCFGHEWSNESSQATINVDRNVFLQANGSDLRNMINRSIRIIRCRCNQLQKLC